MKQLISCVQATAPFYEHLHPEQTGENFCNDKSEILKCAKINEASLQELKAIREDYDNLKKGRHFCNCNVFQQQSITAQ